MTEPNGHTPYIYVPEAGASLDAFISAAAEAAAEDAVAEHTALTTQAHGGIVAATHLDAGQTPDPHTQYLNASRGDSRYYVRATADGRYVLVSSKGQAGGVVPLNASGQIDEAYIPAVAITDVFEVASESAMLGLTAQRGDVAVRSDLSRSFVLRATPASTLTNWAELRTPTDTVLSVDGLTGAVNLATRYAALAHKARHAAGGADPLSPSDIQALSRVWDEGTQIAYGQDLDFRGDGVIVSRDSATGRIFVTISGASAGLASESAAGVVELATATEVQTGTDTVRAVTPAGLDSTLALNMLRIRSTEVSVTGAVTLLTSAIQRMHVCSGTSYTVTLPSPSTLAGRSIAFRVATSGFVTLSSSALIDGQTTRIMWAGETAILLSTGTTWTKVAGQTRPMSAQTRLTNASTPSAAQSIANATITTVNQNTVDFDSGGLADTANNQILIRRPGMYVVNALVTFAFGGASPRVIAYAKRTSDSASVVQSESSVSATNVAPSASGTEMVSFAAADSLTLQCFHSTGSARHLIGEPSSVGSSHISATEITSW